MKREQLDLAGRYNTRAFTILEIATVLVIVLILLTLLFPAILSLQSRGDKARCMANLRSLAVAVNLSVQDHGFWPQIDTHLLTTDKPKYALRWIAELRPYGVTEVGWACPTVQRQMNDPDLNEPKNARIDYIPMPFDAKPRTAFKWSRHPWFVEASSAHGNGNLIIFTNGQVEEALNLVPKPKS